MYFIISFHKLDICIKPVIFRQIYSEFIFDILETFLVLLEDNSKRLLIQQNNVDNVTFFILSCFSVLLLLISAILLTMKWFLCKFLQNVVLLTTIQLIILGGIYLK